MASTNTRLQLPFQLAKQLGQGGQPEVRVLYSTDDASVAVPIWTDATAKLRSFSSSRGRENELTEVDAGTATLTLDNRTRTFDPVTNTAIRPMNRWWIREQFTGETQDIFKGYAESYDQTWPNGMDAEAVVQCADEFKVLALDALPVTNPPRDSYEDLVMFDQPDGYWRPTDKSTAGFVVSGTVGQSLTAVGGMSLSASTAIVGDAVNPFGSFASGASSADYFRSEDVESGSVFDLSYAIEATVETWFRKTGNPAAKTTLLSFPGASATITFVLSLNTTGTVMIEARNIEGPTTFSATSGALVSDQWYHVVGTIEDGFLRLYIDGAQVASTAWTGSFSSALVSPTWLQVGDETTTVSFLYYDELAIYRRGLSADRVGAHFQAGRERGFPGNHEMVSRFHAVLDAADSTAPRKIVPSTTWIHDLSPTYMNGQDPLSELRRIRDAQSVESVFFVTRSGEIAIYGAGHRGQSPWNAVQATFDDDGTDLPYADIGIDYSESFLVNEWNVTREGGLTQTASDATSISKYFKRSQSITGLSVVSDARADEIADALIVRYKDPLTRIQSLALTTDVAEVTEAVFRLDIGDRIRVFRTPPGGGARIDQTLFVQKISVEGGNDGKPWRISLGVSPL